MLEEENNKLTAEEALKRLRAYNEQRWASVEDLVATTKLSDKWVRESLYRLEEEGRLFVKVGPHGIRLYSLRLTEEEAQHEKLISEEHPATVKSATTGGKRRVVEISAGPAVESALPPPIPVLRELYNRREEIRKILLDTSTSELVEVFQSLHEEKRKNERREGNPFGAVKLFATKGIIEGKVIGDSTQDAVMIGTAASAQPCIVGLRFGPVSIPVKFGLTTAAGIIQEIEKGKVVKEPYEIGFPKQLSPERVTEDYDHEFPGMTKIIREIFHYELDHQTLDYALDILRSRLHYKVDMESLDHVRLKEEGTPLLLLKSGSLTPQEQSPFDLLDPAKRTLLLDDVNSYMRLRDRLKDQGPNCFAFGVLKDTEPRRAVIRDIIDELLTRKLPEWEGGRMNTVDDNDVLGLLLDPGEYTPVLKKTPHEDIIESMRDRARNALGSALYIQFETNRQRLKTYQFFMKLGHGRTVRFDCPVFRETSEEGVDIRDFVAPILFSWSSKESELEAPRPRILRYAEDASMKLLNKMKTLAPTWLGGSRK
jgi:hypothetical protein